MRTLLMWPSRPRRRVCMPSVSRPRRPARSDALTDERGLDRARCAGNRGSVYAVLVSQPIEELYQVLGREVARRARRVRASYGAAGRGIERAHAEREASLDVR